jgi:dihydrofolate reductase
MKTVIYGAACSLDGFIAGPDDGVDWLKWSDEVAALSAETFAAVDTVVMGRRTYEVALRLGTRSYPGVRNIVFSKTLAPDQHKEVEVIADDAESVVREMRQEAGPGICVMGGGRLAAALLAAGLIDEIGVNVHPVLLGKGIPFLAHVTRRIDLERIACRPLQHGCVYAYYRVIRSD